MLKLIFFPMEGGTPVYTRASYFRFCSDGTVRGSDNSIAAVVSADGRWRLGQRLFREVECLGPVWLRFRNAKETNAVTMGPYACVNTVAGRLFGDGVALCVDIPGWASSVDPLGYEVSLLEFPGTKALAVGR